MISFWRFFGYWVCYLFFEYLGIYKVFYVYLVFVFRVFGLEFVVRYRILEVVFGSIGVVLEWYYWILGWIVIELGLVGRVVDLGVEVGVGMGLVWVVVREFVVVVLGRFGVYWECI